MYKKNPAAAGFYDGFNLYNRVVICQLSAVFHRNALRFLTPHGSLRDLT